MHWLCATVWARCIGGYERRRVAFIGIAWENGARIMIVGSSAREIPLDLGHCKTGIFIHDSTVL